MNATLTMNGDIVANGTVFANGPVIVQGVDIRAELDKLRANLDLLDQKYGNRIDDAFYFALEHYEMKEEEKSQVRNAIETFKTITDWGGRIAFVKAFLGTFNPVVSIMITQLIKYSDLIPKNH